MEAGIPLGTHEWLDPRSVQVMFSRTRLWAGTIISAPVSEEGGLADFSFEDKLDDLRWYAVLSRPRRSLDCVTNRSPSRDEQDRTCVAFNRVVVCEAQRSFALDRARDPITRGSSDLVPPGVHGSAARTRGGIGFACATRYICRPCGDRNERCECLVGRVSANTRDAFESDLAQRDAAVER